MEQKTVAAPSMNGPASGIILAPAAVILATVIAWDIHSDVSAVFDDLEEFRPLEKTLVTTKKGMV